MERVARINEKVHGWLQSMPLEKWALSQQRFGKGPKRAYESMCIDNLLPIERLFRS